MARTDYAHWNEDADLMWWQEEGRHEGNLEPFYCDLCGFYHAGPCPDDLEDDTDSTEE